jgi:hypothetical protein
LPGGAGRAGCGEDLHEGTGGGARLPAGVVDQVEAPHDPEAADPDRSQPARRPLSLNREDGHERHAEPGQDALLDRLGVG